MTRNGFLFSLILRIYNIFILFFYLYLFTNKLKYSVIIHFLINANGYILSNFDATHTRINNIPRCCHEQEYREIFPPRKLDIFILSVSLNCFKSFIYLEMLYSSKRLFCFFVEVYISPSMREKKLVLYFGSCWVKSTKYTRPPFPGKNVRQERHSPT